jgi:hypothetical protein
MNNNEAKYRIVFEYGRFSPEVLDNDGWKFLGGLGTSEDVNDVRQKIRRLIEINNSGKQIVELLDAEGNPTNA